jgi:hypothetical protein
MMLYFQDWLHLSREGNEKFAQAIHEMITRVWDGATKTNQGTEDNGDGNSTTMNLTMAVVATDSQVGRESFRVAMASWGRWAKGVMGW